MRIFTNAVLFLMIFTVFAVSGGRTVFAACPPYETEFSAAARHLQSETAANTRHATATALVKSEFIGLENWILNSFFMSYLKPTLDSMRDAIISTLKEQDFVESRMVDHKTATDYTMALDKENAEIVKEYKPSEEVCRLGTLSASIASTEDKAGNMKKFLAKQSVARDTLKEGDTSSQGNANDQFSRGDIYRRYHCDPNSFGAAARSLCPKGVEVRGYENMDIDYTSFIETEPTLNLNSEDDKLPDRKGITPDESTIRAMSANLYANQVFDLIEPEVIRANMLDIRSVLAKRNVARNSFNVIASMKATGGDQSKYVAPFARKQLIDLGFGNDKTSAKEVHDDMNRKAGLNPSYDAQMEILTKKLYQNPQFFVNTGDTPANLQRMQVSMQAISLMQDRDIFESLLRSEMVLSVLLELEVEKAQTQLKSRLDSNPSPR